MLGHEDPSVTLRIYADLWGSDLDAVAISMDAKTASASNACPKARLAGRRSRARNCRLASR